MSSARSRRARVGERRARGRVPPHPQPARVRGNRRSDSQGTFRSAAAAGRSAAARARAGRAVRRVAQHAARGAALARKCRPAALAKGRDRRRVRAREHRRRDNHRAARHVPSRRDSARASDRGARDDRIDRGAHRVRAGDARRISRRSTRISRRRSGRCATRSIFTIRRRFISSSIASSRARPRIR